MAEIMKYTQLFRGPVYVADWPGHNYEELFKLQDTNAEPTTNEITIADPTRIGLPPLDTVQTVSQIDIQGEAVDFSPRAAAVLMYGSVEETPAGTTTEDHDAYIGRDIMLSEFPLEVTSVEDEDAVVYERNVDYAVTHVGLRILPGGALATKIAGTVAAPGELKKIAITVDYKYPAVDVIKPFTEGQKHFRVMFGQINEGGNNERRRIRCFYCKISLNGGIPLNQGTDFGTIPVSIKLMSDPNIVDASEAAMWDWKIERK